MKARFWRKDSTVSDGNGAGDAAAHVGAHWDKLTSDAFRRDLSRRSWAGIAAVHQNHNFRVSGDRNVYWATWLRETYFADGFAGDALSLGCGEGQLDRILGDCGFRFRSFTGIDISPRAIAQAQDLANRAALAPTINYLVRDLNTDALPPGPFDFIYFFQSLHHIEALEYVLGQCAAVLRPGGLLMVNDFVGPSRFQWTDQQKAMTKALIALLPAGLRVDLLHGGVKTAPVCPSVDDMMYGEDPSEAVRSGDILAVLARFFEIVQENNWGGTLNGPVFENIAGNFDASNPYHRAIAELLIHHENVLTDSGVIPSDFKLLVVRPRADRAAVGEPRGQIVGRSDDRSPAVSLKGRIRWTARRADLLVQRQLEGRAPPSWLDQYKSARRTLKRLLVPPRKGTRP